MSSQAIRAGAAFVEFIARDESVRKSMDDLKIKFAAFGATVKAVGTSSFSTLNTASTTALSSTAGATSVATAAMALFRSSVNLATASIGALWKMVTSGVAASGASLIALGSILKRLPTNNPLRKMFDGFLDNSVVTELIGRRTRLFGRLFGSSAMAALGTQIERAGLGSAIARGFRDGGISGALSSSVGAGLRSARSMITGFAASAISAPFRAAFAVVSGSASTAVASLTKVATASSSVGAAMARATAPTRGLVGSMFNLAGVASRIFSVAGTVSKFAGAIYAAGVAAAGGFASSAANIVAKAKETGKSIQALIQEKYGKFSFITPADIKAGNALSESMKALKQQIAAAFAQLGIAAMPALKKAVEFMTIATQAVTRFLSENRQLIGIAVSVAGRVAKIAGAITAVGLALPMVGAAVSALMNPTVLFTGAVAAIAASFPQVRQAAADALGYVNTLFQSALQAATNFFNYLFPNAGKAGGTLSGIFQGAIDAIQGGSLQAAAEVAMSGLQVLWLEQTEKLREIFRNAMARVQTVVAEATLIVRTKWEEAVLAMKNTWQALSAMVSATFAPFNSTIDAAKQAWTGLTTFVKTNYQEMKAFIDDQLGQLYNAWKAVIDRISQAWNTAFGAMKEAVSRVMIMMPKGFGEKVKDAALNVLPGGTAVRIGIDTSNALTTDKAKDERAANQQIANDRIAAINAEHALKLKLLAEERAAADAKSKADLEAANRKHQKDKEHAEWLAAMEKWKRQRQTIIDGANTAKASSGLSSGFGSFSARTASLQGANGLGSVQEATQKTAEHTAAIEGYMEQMVKNPPMLRLL